MIIRYDDEMREDHTAWRKTVQQILEVAEKREFIFGHTQSFGRNDEWVKDYVITLTNPMHPRIEITEQNREGAPKYFVFVDDSTTVDDLFFLANAKINTVYEQACKVMYRNYLREQGYRSY